MADLASNKYVVFDLGPRRYALPASQVREIVADQPCFPLPFTPPWVKGVLGRHGEPYTILDLQTLLSGEDTVSDTHILLNLPDDQVALRIHQVTEIVKLGPDQVRRLTSPEGADAYFAGTLALDVEVPVFHLAEILKKLAQDVQTH